MSSVVPRRKDYISHTPRRENFTIIYNLCVNDRNLKGGLLEFMLYMLSKPSTWIVETYELADRFDLNLATVRKRLRDLSSLGYIKRETLRNPDGSFLKTVTYVNDEPIHLDYKQPHVQNPPVGFSPLVPYRSKTDLNKTDLKQAASKQGNTNTREASTKVSEQTEGIAAAAIFENVAGRENRDEPVSRVVGNSQIAETLYQLLDEQLPLPRMLAAIEHYGAPKVVAAVKVVAQKMKTENISNMGAFLRTAIERDWASEKTTTIDKKRPSQVNQSPIGNSNSSQDKNNDSPRDVGNSNNIEFMLEHLQAKSHWSVAENREFYRRLGRENRQTAVDEVARKWTYIYEHAKFQKVDLLSDEFAEHILFAQFADVLNRLRFEKAAHHFRTKIWNET